MSANPLQGYPTAAVPAGDDWLYLQGATNSIRKLSPTYYVRKASPQMTGAGVIDGSFFIKNSGTIGDILFLDDAGAVFNVPICENVTAITDSDSATISLIALIIDYQRTDAAPLVFPDPTTAENGQHLSVTNSSAAGVALNGAVASSFFNGSAGVVSSITLASKETIVFIEVGAQWRVFARYLSNSSGSGDFSGPASSTANAVVRFSGTGGKTGKNSGVVVDDSNNVSGLVALTTTGIETATGASVQTGTAVSGNAINVAKTLNTQSLSGDVTVTFSGTPTANQVFGYKATADSSARTVTLPAGVLPFGASSAVASFVVPANSTLLVQFFYDGSTYFIAGNPVITTGTGNFALIQGSLVVASGKTLTVNQTTTLDRQASTGLPVEFFVSCSDLTTAITTGTNKAYFRAPYAFTITEVRASLLTAQTAGSIFTVNIKESGTTILSTKLTIDNNENTSTTAATPPVISDASIADDAVVSFDIDQIGTSGAAGLIVCIKGYR